LAIIALIASRLVSPASKLATARELAATTAASSLGRLLGLGEVDGVELYRALDWLGARQSAIETGLAHRHLDGNSDQFIGRHRVARNQKKQIGIVPGHDGGTAPVDVVGCRFRSQLVDACRMPCYLTALSGIAISHIGR
jgi:hypothetical protein